MKKSFSANPLSGNLADIARSVASGGVGKDSENVIAQGQHVTTAPGKREGHDITGKKKKPASAETGCRPGYSRHTYILPVEVIEQIRNIASYCKQSESSTVEELLKKGIDDAIARNGRQIVREIRKKSLFG